MNAAIKKQIVRYFSKQPVVAVYFFGSQQKKKAGISSDFDFAILFNYEMGPIDRLNHKLTYISYFSQLLHTFEERIDVVDLNSASFPIGFAAIQGELIVCKNTMQRVLFETKTMADMHTDYYYIEHDYYSMIEKIRKGEYFHVAK